jgi:autotransporter-associated beta strand protein
MELVMPIPSWRAIPVVVRLPIRAMALIMVLQAGLPVSAAGGLVDFSDLSVPADGVFNGDPGDLVPGQEVSRPWVSQGASFSNTYGIFDGGSFTFAYWFGFAYSNRAEAADPEDQGSIRFQYDAYPGPPRAGGTYAVASGGGAEITFSGPSTVEGVLVANTTYAYLTMVNGDEYNFASPLPEGSGWFGVTASGLRAGVSTGDATFLLADLRGDAPLGVRDGWAWFDLRPLGEVDALRFSFSGSDLGPFGLNTPAYFALGELVFDPRPTPPMLVVDVGSGQIQTQAQAGYPMLSGTTPVQKTGLGTLVLDAANTISTTLAVKAGTAVAADTQALGTATLDLAAGATLAIAPVVGAANAVQVADLGTIAGRIDVGTGRFVLPASEESPGAELRSLVIAGRSGGSWGGSSGILSSDAPTYDGKSGFAVGYRVAGDNSATVAWASLGDADLDGAVTTADVNAILASGLFNTGTAGATWQQGDFDYDGLITTADINALLTTGRLNTGSYLPATPSTPDVSPTVVPEPATTWPMAVGFILAALAGGGWLRSGPGRSTRSPSPGPTNDCHRRAAVLQR